MLLLSLLGAGLCLRSGRVLGDEICGFLLVFHGKGELG